MSAQGKIKVEGATTVSYYMVPPDAIVVDQKLNNRYGIYVEDDFRDLLADLDSGKGIETPVVCRPLADLQPLLVEGYRRHAAITLWNSRHRPTEAMMLPVIVREMNATEALEANVSENVNRKSLTPMDVAIGIRNLTAKGLNDSQIKVIYRKSEPWVSRQRLLLRLDKEMRDKVHQSLIKGTAAIELAEMEEEIRGIVVTTIERDYKSKFSITNIRKVGREVGGFGDGITPRPLSSAADDDDAEFGIYSDTGDTDEQSFEERVPARSVKVDDSGKPAAPITRKKGHTPRRKQRTLRELNEYWDRWDLNPALTPAGQAYVRLEIGLLSGRVADAVMDKALLEHFGSDSITLPGGTVPTVSAAGPTAAPAGISTVVENFPWDENSTIEVIGDGEGQTSIITAEQSIEQSIEQSVS